MFKKFSNIKGIKEISKNEQKNITGGNVSFNCVTDSDCILSDNPFCISACITFGGSGVCVYDTTSCF
ncbi:hypothetical protein [uncultured Tenacibaculum sp.]|uniref:hypothetical protein n=1 Tax=uncultured Tenacibaculum sp. TaxID=174713 RepID=UPI002630E8F9|nr:hypothetical protein [uncultured Tenacibaculum sp.]